jgi:cysteinyl-tRNA synthetase
VTLTLYNTLTRSKGTFQPIDPTNVRIYVCGPTVYGDAHIGNARPVIVFDVLFRLLRYIFGRAHVTYVRNITDVDDKINARAAQEGISIRELTERTVKQYHDDVAALGALAPTVEPRATEHLAKMRTLCKVLAAKGHAYVAEDHVLFHVPSMPDYGQLSNRSLEEMEAGARVDVAPYKRDPMDFVLWKPSKTGEPSWSSPLGIAAPGRPGWHIECSAMAEQHLGETFDIHGGGIDLVFPHHENEIAQSRCAHGTPVMANVWMHNGFLQVEGEKMSKSLQNFVTINQLLHSDIFGGRKWPGEVLRLAMLLTHYRQPIDWTVKGLEDAHRIGKGWRRAIEGLSSPSDASPDARFVAALSNDLNTPAAIAILHELAAEAKSSADARDRLLGSARLLGLFTSEQHFSGAHLDIKIDTAEVERLVSARLVARRSKNFKEADRIRDELAMKGIALNDSKDPASGEIVTTWEIKW